MSLLIKCLERDYLIFCNPLCDCLAITNYVRVSVYVNYQHSLFTNNRDYKQNLNHYLLFC